MKGDFILTPNVPAMVAPGDEFIVSVGVFNNSTGDERSHPPGSAARARDCRSQGPATRRAADRGEEGRRRRVPLQGQRACWAPATLKFTARRGTAEAHIEESVSVRPAVAFRTQLTLGRVDGASAVAALTRDMFSEQRKVEAAVSTLPLVWGQGLIAYLDNYPYPCTEQLVSKGMSALLLTSRPEFGTREEPRRAPARRDVLDAAQPRERSGRLRPVVVVAGDGRVPDRLRRAFPDGGQGPRPEDSAGDADAPRRVARRASPRRPRAASPTDGCAPTPSTCWRVRASSRTPRCRTSSRSCRIATRRRGRPIWPPPISPRPTG